MSLNSHKGSFRIDSQTRLMVFACRDEAKKIIVETIPFTGYIGPIDTPDRVPCDPILCLHTLSAYRMLLHQKKFFYSQPKFHCSCCCSFHSIDTKNVGVAHRKYFDRLLGLLLVIRVHLFSHYWN